MIVPIAISWYLIGLLVFYTSATFHPTAYNTWNHAYYLWAKVNDALFLYIIIAYPKAIRKQVKPAIFLAIVRAVWEVISWITGVQTNNTVAVGILFIILIVICLYLTIKETIQWRT